MKNVLNHVHRRQGISMVQRLSILVENRSQWGPVQDGAQRLASDGWVSGTIAGQSS
jgi:hypothetical protein